MRLTSLFIIVITLINCSDHRQDYKTKVQNPEYLHQSMKAITDRMVYDVFSPPVASRIYAYASVAAYEASIPEHKNYKTLAGQLHGLAVLPQVDTTLEYCFPLAATHAMLKVGRALVFTEAEVGKFYDSIMNEFHKTGIPQDVFDRSVAYGEEVGKHVLDWSAKDNYKQSRSFPKYTIDKTSIATWQPTPPGYMDAIEPHWSEIRTFAIDSAQQFKPIPPTAFSLDKKSQFYKDADEVYETGKSLTEEQRAIASFWDCNPFFINVKGHLTFGTKKISPGGHWVNIARVAATKSNADFVKAAETYALLSVSMADAFISCWDEKYRSRLVRPETYINKNIDPTWAPLLQTPPFPEYTSGHSVVSGASSVVLTKLYGDHFSYTDSTEVEFGLKPRSFTSFQQAAEEAAVSRMYGGIHYKPACENGKTQGRAIGNFVLSKITTH